MNQRWGGRIMSDEMDRYVCTECGYIYDPAEGDSKGGIPPGVSFENLPENWVCPECGAGKDAFVKIPV
jgi:rubredoxin